MTVLPFFQGGLALLCLALTACKPQLESTQSEKAPDPDLLAQVGSHELRTRDFQQWIAQRPPGLGGASNSVLLNEWINRQAQLHRAVTLQLDRDPQLIRSWENTLIGKLREKELESQMSNSIPTAEEISAYYQKHLGQYTDRPRKRMAMIFLETGSKMNEERRTALRQRMEQARALATDQATNPGAHATTKNSNASRGFGNIATQFSQDQASRYQGGDIGWITQDLSDPRIEPAALQTAWKLSSKELISPIIETPKGLYLFKWIDEQPGGPKPQSMVEASIRQRLLQEKRAQLESAWIDSLRTQAVVRIYPETVQKLSQFTKPAPPRSAPGEPPPVP